MQQGILCLVEFPTVWRIVVGAIMLMLKDRKEDGKTDKHKQAYRHIQTAV